MECHWNEQGHGGESQNKSTFPSNIIVKGKAYTEKYEKSIQTRNVFTIGAFCNFCGGTSNWKNSCGYEYMFLLPNEHAKLLKFKPQVPDGAAEILAPCHLLSNTMPPAGVDFVHHYKKPEA
ncbi:hypothetical protein POTOM_004407 [Populus tomentosa]|uniref:Uncharacterized protein n=1 Tax=Populus tomentosa TaxID=118781 RepID=A0A8X8AQG9_POPTO|nr:hypothetical protein POTOM_004407 [Populus tomentosa]